MNNDKGDMGAIILALIGLLFMALLLPLGVTVLSIVIMIYGWGVTPENWYILLGGYGLQFAIMYGIQGLKEIVKYFKKDEQ